MGKILDRQRGPSLLRCSCPIRVEFVRSRGFSLLACKDADCRQIHDCVQVMLNAVKCTIATFFFLAVVPFRIQAWRTGLELHAQFHANATAFAFNSTARDSAAVEPSTGSTITVSGSPRFDMLVLSAFLGIAVGDIVWLQALQSLGARKLILVDSVKPFCGALFAWMFLGEEMRPTSALGILVRLCVCVLAGLRARVLSHAYVRVVLCACLLESIPGN